MGSGEIEDDSEIEQGFDGEPFPQFEEGAPELESEGVQSPLPSLQDAEALISDRTKLLMDELFRARIQRVKRIDPKDIL